MYNSSYDVDVFHYLFQITSECLVPESMQSTKLPCININFVLLLYQFIYKDNAIDNMIQMNGDKMIITTLRCREKNKDTEMYESVNPA